MLKDELRLACKMRGILLENYKTSTAREYTQWLGKWSLENGLRQITEGLQMVRTMDGFMLCSNYSQLNNDFKLAILEDNNNWVVEENVDGVRAWVYYNKGTIQVFGRDLSSKDFLPEEYYIDIPHCTVGDKFLLDVKISSKSPWITKEVVKSVLRSEKNTSKDFQELNPFDVTVLDIVYLNGNSLTNMPLSSRRDLLETLKLPERFSLVKQYKTDKLTHSHKLVDNGKDGVIFKNLDSIYLCNTRSIKRWVKLKVHSKQELFDAIYTGG